jgi:hypothetical protein
MIRERACVGSNFRPLIFSKIQKFAVVGSLAVGELIRNTPNKPDFKRQVGVDWSGPGRVIGGFPDFARKDYGFSAERLACFPVSFLTAGIAFPISHPANCCHDSEDRSDINGGTVSVILHSIRDRKVNIFRIFSRYHNLPSDRRLISYPNPRSRLNFDGYLGLFKGLSGYAPSQYRKSGIDSQDSEGDDPNPKLYYFSSIILFIFGFLLLAKGAWNAYHRERAAAWLAVAGVGWLTMVVSVLIFGFHCCPNP